MSSLASRTVVRLKDFRTRDVGSRVSNVVGSLADHLVSGVQGWSSKARSAAETTDGFVRSSPWRAAGAIAVAGLAAGILVSRSARRARRRAADANIDSTSEVLGG
jgi:ElaB/YqjD/DUF883 family membrane-anchored ribosome-binding protein